MRTLIRLLTVVGLVTAGLLVPVSGTAPTDVARAAGVTGFDAGNIISDAVFFDSGAMDAAAVQRFLELRGARCVAAEMPCLKDFAQDTLDQPADAMCAGYRGAPGETAATIITKVARSCGINPRVLLVLLQKEQGLVTKVTPTRYAYTNATGFACPDTAPCNPAFSGFVSQVYFAARQFQRYRVEASRYGYKAGRVNTIQWDVERACGTSQVFIANQATAGLYNYTPYRPNQASLNAYPGEGDSCSSYGNRNFYAYFVNWFGTTQSVGGNAVHEKYELTGGATGPLGPATDIVRCGILRGGCYQIYRSGAIYWSPASGAHTVVGAIWETWRSQGWETGRLGYPTTDENCGLRDGGCWQGFENGTMHWSHASGAHAMLGAVRDKWGATGWEAGPLGYPVDELWCGLVSGGCTQTFQRGAIYWTGATGARVVSGAIRDEWGSQGWEAGVLGYPTADARCGLADGGCAQEFQRGTIGWAQATGAHAVGGAIRDRWTAGGRENGTLGWPTGDMWCGLAQGGCVQDFEGGALYWSAATGARAVSGPIRQYWGAQGWENGPLGYPRRELACDLVDSGCWQEFQNGAVYWTATTGAHAVSGPILAHWASRGWEAGPLGYPVEEARAVTGGVSQRFAGGTLTWSSATGQVTQR